MPERLARGYPLERLPGERTLREITHAVSGPEGADHLVLTDQRLVALTNHKLLWFIPLGISIESAFIKDVDLAGLAHRRLSFLLAIFGGLIFLGGIGGVNASEEDGSGKGAFIFMIMLGVAMVAAWLLVKRKYLVFTVSGEWHFSFRAIGGNSDEATAGFINAFSLLKAGGDPGEQPSLPSTPPTIPTRPSAPQEPREDPFRQRPTAAPPPPPSEPGDDVPPAVH